MKPEIEWICTTSGVDKTMPVIRSSEYQHKWQLKAVQDMKTGGSLSSEYRKDWKTQDGQSDNKQLDKSIHDINPDLKETGVWKLPHIRHTAKCPALQLWHNTGFILRLHQDLKMKTIDNGEDISWITSFQSSKIPLVSKHLTHSLYPFFDMWPKNTLKKIIKVTLPWKARIPKGYKLLQMHPYMLDDNRFTTVAGVLHPHNGLAPVGSIPMWIHVTDDNEEITIEEGTPLAQYILVPQEEPDFKIIDSIDDPNYIKEERMNHLLLSGKFQRSYTQIRNFWKEYGW